MSPRPLLIGMNPVPARNGRLPALTLSANELALNDALKADSEK